MRFSGYSFIQFLDKDLTLSMLNSFQQLTIARKWDRQAQTLSGQYFLHLTPLKWLIHATVHAMWHEATIKL